METTTKPFGMTGRLAGVSSRSPWKMVLLWVAIFVGMIVVSVGFPAELTTDIELTNDPESYRADAILEERMDPASSPRVDEYVVVASDTIGVDQPEFRAFVDELIVDIQGLGEGVAFASSYYQLNDPALLSDDGKAMIVPVGFSESGVDDQSYLDVIDERDGLNGFSIASGGDMSIDTAFTETSESDLITGETIGISVAMLVLVIVFGTLVAAGVPLVLSIVAIMISMGVVAIVGHVFELSIFVINMMIMIGLAVGIDYSLFIVGRYREERERGLSTIAALIRTGDTASKAVLFSGLTVVIALLGMLIVPSTLFRSLGAGAIFVVVVSVLATLTLLPAALTLIGRGIDRGRGRVLMGALTVILLLFAAVFNAMDIGTIFVVTYIVLAVASLALAVLGIDPFHTRQPNRDGGFWDRVTHFVLRRPVALVVTTVAILLAASAVYFTINLGESGISTLPKETSAYRAFNLLETRFSAISLESPNSIVVDATDVNDPAIQSAMQELVTTVEADDAFGTTSIVTNSTGNLAMISVPSVYDTRSTAALKSIERLRSDYIPAAFDGTDAEVLVTGPTAFSLDFNDTVDTYTPIVFAFVLGVSFLLLLLAFRSVVVPLKSVIMNLLSVGASYGLLVAVFQHGIGNELFGFQQVERIDAWVPLMMFSILFGLSMDYHVFLLSRIRERYDVTRDNIDSISHGLRTTASMITGAALIMVAVFGGFAMGELSMFQQMGFGLATAVILDATIIRSVLVPASMRLLGDLNWYFPSWLEWLPNINVEGVPEHGHDVGVDDRSMPEGAVAD